MGASTQEKAYVIENIFMFMPLGMLRALRKTSLFHIKNVLKELYVYTGISCIIEGAQLVTGRGYCQIDDVVMNVLGGILGYLLIRLLKLLFKNTCLRMLLIWYPSIGGISCFTDARTMKV